MAKLENLSNNGLSELKGYLYNMLEDCPNSYFDGDLRGSQLKFKMNFNVENLTEHEVNILTKYGLIVNNSRFKNNHSKVQVFMLEHDNKTVAMEIPIWVKKDEVNSYGNLFGLNNFLTGHIDILRIEDGKIWVWDYKPNAQRENYATTQVYFYALMLAKRANIDLKHFMCGYFDSNFTYTFDPSAKNDLKIFKKGL